MVNFMELKFLIKKYFLKTALVFSMFSLFAPVAQAQYESFEQCLGENGLVECCSSYQGASSRSECQNVCKNDNDCAGDLVCDTSTNRCIIDTDTVPNVSGTNGNSIDNLSGRVSGNTASPNAAGCQKSDDQCPAPNFCYINGVCVPVPKSSTGIIGAASVFDLITIVLRWLFTFAGVIATVFLILGGYQYMTSAGNEEAAEKGKKTIINAIIGIVAVVFAITVITIITNTLSGDNPRGYYQKSNKA